MLKQTRPDRAVEIAVHTLCAQIAPGLVDEPLAHDQRSARVLFDDGGPTLLDTGRVTPQVIADLLTDYAALQQSTIGHDAQFAAVGVPTFDPRHAGRELELQAHHLRRLPAADPRHITPRQLTRLIDARPKFDRAGAVVAASTVPPCLDHGDLWPGNVLDTHDGTGHYRFIDFGDAAWTHPFLSVMPLLRYCHGVWSSAGAAFDVTGTSLRPVTSAYLDAWNQYGSATELTTTFLSAARVAPLRRSRAVISNAIQATAADATDLGPTPWGWLTTLDDR